MIAYYKNIIDDSTVSYVDSRLSLRHIIHTTIVVHKTRLHVDISSYFVVFHHIVNLSSSIVTLLSPQRCEDSKTFKKTIVPR